MGGVFKRADNAHDWAHGRPDIIPTGGWIIEAGNGAIQKERVFAVELVAKEAGEFVKSDKAVCDDEIKSAGFLIHANTIASFEARAVWIEFRVDLIVDDQHRARLSGVIRRWSECLIA